MPFHMLITKEVSFSMGDHKEKSHYVKHSTLIVPY